MKKNYFLIIAPEILFMIIDSLIFDSGWELKEFALTCRQFYTFIKKQTKCIELSTNKYHFDFDALLDEKKGTFKNICKKIQHIILFEEFKTFHIT
ncbi:9129_t:CDS:1, partial [Gigaspora margarita]